MAKSPEEIKKGLECCSNDENREKCVRCPYFDGTCGRDLYAIEKDALALIQQLQAQNVELLEKVEQLKAERDAMASELVGTCQVCRWEETAKCASCHFCECAWNTYESNWEWRGVQKEE